MENGTMKRSEFFDFINGRHDRDDLIFEMTYKKKNGEIRHATCKMNDGGKAPAKGTGMGRVEKMDKLQVFQYYDINSDGYRSARLENIIDFTINGEVTKLED